MNADQATMLAGPLNASRVKSRQGRGGGPALSYLETHDIIRTANMIFGFGNWGHEIVELRSLPGVAVKSSAGKDGIHVGYVCVVRLTVDGCVPTSGIGYGDAVEYTQAAPVSAHELAAKEAESDALKRALKNYGDQFGLALYDKQAASSGHVVKASGSPPGGSTPVAPAATPPAAGATSPTAEALAEYGLMCEAWKKVSPAFDVPAAKALALDGKDGAWVVRATRRLQENIDAKIAESENKPEPAFKVPDKAKKAAA